MAMIAKFVWRAMCQILMESSAPHERQGDISVIQAGITHLTLPPTISPLCSFPNEQLWNTCMLLNDGLCTTEIDSIGDLILFARGRSRQRAPEMLAVIEMENAMRAIPPPSLVGKIYSRHSVEAA
jgi:hypothetical protein